VAQVAMISTPGSLRQSVVMYRCRLAFKLWNKLCAQEKCRTRGPFAHADSLPISPSSKTVNTTKDSKLLFEFKIIIIWHKLISARDMSAKLAVNGIRTHAHTNLICTVKLRSQ